MANKIIEKMKRCKKCKKHTVHKCNSDSMGILALMINIILVVITGGFWLIPLFLYLILTIPFFSKWTCSEH